MELESFGNFNRIVLVYKECLLSELPLDVLRDYCELMKPLEGKELRFKKLSNFAIDPTRATDGSIGYDLYSAVNMTIFPHNKGLIATDIALSCPIGYIRESLPVLVLL